MHQANSAHAEEPLQVGQHAALRIGPSPLHGLGVFADEPIAEGAVLEVAPILLVPDEEEEHLARTVLKEYYFRWDGGVAIALGYGAIYNHSYEPNASYLPWPLEGFEHGVFVLTALRPIAVGEEITHNYAGGTRGRGKLWFDVKT